MLCPCLGRVMRTWRLERGDNEIRGALIPPGDVGRRSKDGCCALVSSGHPPAPSRSRSARRSTAGASLSCADSIGEVGGVVGLAPAMGVSLTVNIFTLLSQRESGR